MPLVTNSYHDTIMGLSLSVVAWVSCSDGWWLQWQNKVHGNEPTTFYVKPQCWLLCWYTSKICNTPFSIPLLHILVTTVRSYQQIVEVFEFQVPAIKCQNALNLTAAVYSGVAMCLMLKEIVTLKPVGHSDLLLRIQKTDIYWQKSKLYLKIM